MEEIIPNNILKVSHISASYQEGKQRKTVLHDISFELLKMKFSVSSEKADAENRHSPK